MLRNRRPTTIDIDLSPLVPVVGYLIPVHEVKSILETAIELVLNKFDTEVTDNLPGYFKISKGVITEDRLTKILNAVETYVTEVLRLDPDIYVKPSRWLYPINLPVYFIRLETVN